jgi:hypothetical protein
MAAPDDITWLHQTYYTETLKVYTNVWDIYIKFYTVFLTANVLGLGLAAEHIAFGKRWPVVIAFMLQNVLTVATSLGVAAYGDVVHENLSKVAEVLVGSSPGVAKVLKGSPVPTTLSRYAAYANALGCASLIVCWYFAATLPNPVETKPAPTPSAAQR